MLVFLADAVFRFLYKNTKNDYFMLEIEVYILKFHTDSEFHNGFAQKCDFDDFPIFWRRFFHPPVVCIEWWVWLMSFFVDLGLLG